MSVNDGASERDGQGEAPEGGAADGSGRHEPKQTRGVETRNAILDAAAALYAEQGYDATTTHQIASRAGVSVGALYRYFADKEAVLVETYRCEMTDLRDRILREFRVVEMVGKDLGALATMALDLAFHVFAERPSLRRVLVEQSRRVASLAALRQAQEQEVRATVRQILAAVPDVRLPDVDVGAYLVSLFMESLIDDVTLYPGEDPGLDRERILRGAIDFVLSYVTGARPSGSEP